MSEFGHDLVTRYDISASITPGIKTPASYVSSGKTSFVSRVRYAFCTVFAVNGGSQLRAAWQMSRLVTPFDLVRIPGTRSPAITPVPGNYWMRIGYDLLGHELPFPTPAREFGGIAAGASTGLPSIAAEWEVVGGTNIVAAFWEIDLPADNKSPSFGQVNGFGSGFFEQDSNGNDRMIMDLANNGGPNSLYKPSGNPVLT